MKTKPIRVSRSVLYEAIWEKPPEELAHRLGIGLEELSRACEQLDIPQPSEDYWRRKASALPVIKRRMSPLSKGAPTQITFHAPMYPLFPRKLHPQVTELVEQRSVRAAHAKAHGWEPVPDAPGERRRLSMMSRLFHGVELQGIHPSIGELNEIEFGVRDVRINCRLWTKLKKAPAPLSEHARKRLPYRLRHRNLVSTGMLAFEFTSRVSEFGVRRLWSEAIGRPFESMVPEIVAAISTVANESSRRRGDEELASQRRALEFERERADEARWREFSRIAEARDFFLRARNLLHALESEATDVEAVVGDRTVGEWLTWLRARLVHSEPSPEGVVEILRRLAKAPDER